MIVLLSSAKTLDLDSPWRAPLTAEPEFIVQAKPLMEQLRKRSVKQLGKLLGVSAKIAQLNAERNAEFSTPFTERNARPALFTYQGDVYEPLREETYTVEQLTFAHRTIRTVSGLFGIVRALDLIQPYRLEMATKLAGPGWTDLYDYWSERVTRAVDRDAAAEGGPIVNLASQEYAAVIDRERLRAPWLTVTFKEDRAGALQVIGIRAKRARGLMAEFIIANLIDRPERLREFRAGGYRFEPAASSESEWVFVRRA